ncbi:sigma-70 family RNA polymerase sigma factor [Aeoliella sp. ICT_H6.2]|uniref:Sigma-70 family RNA polymerase sigma factor n=1 Tax=Aeoliella straminimaris TaxID=2954799 RepID=A0A9X2FAR3_9BACT|nr:sigma-70 family RNA polymerase sigma factor [Aeoliella straminimaris]MCO6044753.1 sigma-70 family RNA polymerase sigma factor [Aeoliella straminimaris]
MPSKEEEFAELFGATQQRLFGMLVSMLRNSEDARDVLQQTAVTAWENYSDFEPGTDFFRWMAALAKYETLTFINYKRRSKLYFKQEMMDQLVDDACGLSDESIEARCTALRECVTKLADTDRKLIDCRYTHGLGSHGTAKLLDRSQASVCNSLRRIRQSLLRCIKRTLSEEKVA